MVMHVDDQRLLLPMVYGILGRHVNESNPNMFRNNIVNMSHWHRKMEQICLRNVHLHIRHIIDHRVHTV